MPSRLHASASSSPIDPHSSPRHIITVDTISSGAQQVRLITPATAAAKTSFAPPTQAPERGASSLVASAMPPNDPSARTSKPSGDGPVGMARGGCCSGSSAIEACALAELADG